MRLPVTKAYQSDDLAGGQRSAAAPSSAILLAVLFCGAIPAGRRAGAEPAEEFLAA